MSYICLTIMKYPLNLNGTVLEVTIPLYSLITSDIVINTAKVVSLPSVVIGTSIIAGIFSLFFLFRAKLVRNFITRNVLPENQT